MNELHALIASMLEDRLSASDAKKLQSLLENDPEARRIYAEQCQLHARLSKDSSLETAIQADTPIDFDESESVENAPPARSAWSRLSSSLGIIAASVAISFVGIIAFLNLQPTGEYAYPSITEAPKRSPQETYEQADFPESGNLKRPPTNFATIAPQGDGKTISFNRDIRPILSDNCYHCHGPDANTREAELRLDIEANAFTAHGEFEPAIIRGDPENSPLYQRIISPLKSDIMPPPDSHKVLTAEQKDKVRQWIEEGAEWEAHWSFMQPKKHPVPPAKWGNGPIDAFLLKEMTRAGLEPSPEADKATLARRLALDLTGLPLDPDALDQFVADNSSDAYEKLVDRLLDSRAFGEHQARYWLDAARYSDTHGLHLDNYREIWPYRDWVIQAFNENKPFDDFIVEQIAGDLLPGSTLEQQIATGFNRCNPTTSEGGAIEDEYRAIYAKDRVETTATVFLGLTMGCASCHDHKFDPIDREDFYQFSAFFNNLDGPIMDRNAYDTEPVAVIPFQGHEAKWKAIRPIYEEAKKAFDQLKRDREDAYDAWLEAGDATFPNPLEGSSYSLKLEGKSEKKNAEKKADETDLPRFKMGESIELPGAFDKLGNGDAFTIAFTYKTPRIDPHQVVPIMSKFDGDRGWRIFLIGGDDKLLDRYRVRVELIRSLKNNDLISITTKASRRGNPTPNKSIKFSLAYDGTGKAEGVTIGAPGRQVIDKRSVKDQLSGAFETDAPLQFHEAVAHPEADNGQVESLSFYASEVPLHSVNHILALDNRKAIYKKGKEARKFEKESLRDYYFALVDPVTSKLQNELARSETRYRFYYDQATVSLVMKEKDEPAFAHMLERGEYDKPGEKVFPALPKALGSLSPDAPKNRLSLANWLVDPSNPLTARVTVNRIWQNFFGTGIVETSEDFGIMGENPSHPELLDWLAIDFQENDWDHKRFIRQIVTSAAYKQDSRIRGEALEIDPENRLLARGPRYRLDGETLRDQALYVSGSLNEEFGGPPVHPYQPKGIWNAVAYSGSNTRFYKEDKGDALYRRSIYTFWKRTAPPPNMIVFDAPSRENCSVRRVRTNTPLQALTLMNDPQYVEAARQLAQRAWKQSDGKAYDSIESMYRFAFGSNPPESHQDILEESYSKFKYSFSEDVSRARDLLEIGDSIAPEDANPVELASLTMVANQIMNLDSFINKY